MITIDEAIKLLKLSDQAIWLKGLEKERKEAENMAIKALEQQPCEDVISRDCDKCAYYDDGANHEACDECFADEYEHPNFKPKAQPCDDCISRQAVLELVGNYDLSMGQVVKAIHALPSVTPKEKTGHWKPIEYDGYADGYPVWDVWECSKCGGEHNGDKESLTAFCPDCGAKMIEPQESEEV